MDINNTIEKLTISFVDEWNDLNPGKKINEIFIEKLAQYFHYSYVAGIDQTRTDIFRFMDRTVDATCRVRASRMKEFLNNGYATDPVILSKKTLKRIKIQQSCRNCKHECYYQDECDGIVFQRRDCLCYLAETFFNEHCTLKISKTEIEPVKNCPYWDLKTECTKTNTKQK